MTHKTMLALEQLAERLGKTVWSKGDLKRIYMNDVADNTKKMRSTVYIYQQDGEFKVSVFIECDSQPMAWINGQKKVYTQHVMSLIDEAINNEE